MHTCVVCVTQLCRVALLFLTAHRSFGPVPGREHQEPGPPLGPGGPADAKPLAADDIGPAVAQFSSVRHSALDSTNGSSPVSPIREQTASPRAPEPRIRGPERLLHKMAYGVKAAQDTG